jgi:hypothetical protein
MVRNRTKEIGRRLSNIYSSAVFPAAENKGNM